nr:MAG TPA: hypothetical protein [Caudoviricetes sp.]
MELLGCRFIHPKYRIIHAFHSDTQFRKGRYFLKNERSICVMKKVYNIIMYTAIFIACYCTYCKVITMTVDIYSSSKH